MFILHRKNKFESELKLSSIKKKKLNRYGYPILKK